MSELNQASGTVTESGKTTTGKTKLKIGGQWYYMGRDLNGAAPALGTSINLRYSLFGDKGDLRSLEAWRPVTDAANQSNVATPIPTSAPVDEASLRFISNVVGSAISAGTVKSPNDVLSWFEAARLALEGKAPMTDQQRQELIQRQYNQHLQQLKNHGPVPGIDDRQPSDDDEYFSGGSY